MADPDFNSYRGLVELIDRSESGLFINRYDETVLLQKMPNEEGNKCVCKKTFQQNDWVRVQFYWEDGTYEEHYER